MPSRSTASSGLSENMGFTAGAAVIFLGVSSSGTRSLVVGSACAAAALAALALRVAAAFCPRVRVLVAMMIGPFDCGLFGFRGSPSFRGGFHVSNITPVPLQRQDVFFQIYDMVPIFPYIMRMRS